MASKNQARPTLAKLLLAGMVGTGVLGLVSAMTGSGATPAPPADAAYTVGGKYIGAGKCKNCHKAEDAGNQYAGWEAGPHAKAFETLASDKAKEIATERGIEDPQKSDDCLKCHTTGHGEADNIKKGFKTEHGVQCESCHGPGESHMKERFKAVSKNKGKAPDYAGLPETEIVSAVGKDTCVKCHNEESPTFKPFCFHQRAKAIRHLNPLKPRTPEELAALDKCDCDKDCVCVTSGDCKKE